jgi:hypothetical protein
MSRATDQNRLLADVLDETEPPGFREALLGETLQLVGRRRRTRRLQRATAAIAVAGLFVTLAWQVLMTGNPTVTPSKKSCTLVRTAPFPRSAIITTQAFSGDRILTSVATVAVVRTRSDSGRFHDIDDDTLLALVAPRPAALVRIGPRSERLIFVTPDGATSSDAN